MRTQAIIKTPFGRLRGRLAEGVFAFKGIPYAAPPVGRLWLQAPRPPESWSGLRSAEDYGPTPPQNPGAQTAMMKDPLRAGDEYLNLNVWTPELGATNLPVLFWIHGGGFFCGSGATAWYSGQRLARLGIVVVTINYRLGIEGFLDIRGAPPHRGAMDWLAALQWVNRNIHRFGGASNRVTVAGQSAGGTSALFLSGMSEAEGRLAGVIAMSASTNFAPTAAGRAAAARRVGQAVGGDVSVERLRSLPPGALLKLQAAIDRGDGTLEGTVRRNGLHGPLFAPYADGEVLTFDPLHAVTVGPGRRLPLLIGATADETAGAILSAMPATATTDEIGPMFSVLGAPDWVRAEYESQSQDGDPKTTLARAMCDRVFRSTVPNVCRGRTGEAGTYVYDFRWRRDGSRLGAFHSSEIPFVFGTVDAPGAAEVTAGASPELVYEMSASWARFVTTGSPGWQRANSEHLHAQVFGSTERAIYEDQQRLWPYDRAGPARQVGA